MKDNAHTLSGFRTPTRDRWLLVEENGALCARPDRFP
jgi:hypothetical protein